MVTNIKIVTSTGRQIDYINAEDFGIKMNRVAIDMTKPDERFGEYSYSFSLPMTRNNIEVFGFAGSPNVKDIFKINPIEVKVFNNDVLLLSGQIELNSIETDKYKCVLYSKLTQLVDALKDKNMQDIKSCPKITWNYEETIKGHWVTGGTDCDDSPFKFPLVFYNTFYAPTSSFTGLTDTVVDANGQTNHIFQRERDAQNWYYLINHAYGKTENEYYVHQIPLCFHLKSAMEFLLADIGWTMGGSFWEDKNIKRIVMPYVGDTDVYDRAKYCDNGGWISGGTCFTGDTWLPLTKPIVQCGKVMLDTAKFMPDYDCISFLEDVIKLFNLYMMIDINQKTIVFETYDVMFGSRVAPYNINNKVIGENVVSKVDDNNPTVTFSDIPNQRILGDNRYIASSGTSAFHAKYLITANNTLFDNVFNYIGSTDGQIKIGFGAPAVKRMRIRNDYDINDNLCNAGDTVLFLPMITKALPEDNGGKNFSKKDGDSTAYNNEETIQYNGKPALYYYYGVSSSDFEQNVQPEGNMMFINFADTNCKIPFCSPFALTSYRGLVNQVLNDAYNNPQGTEDSVEVMIASYMQSIYLMMAGSAGVPTNLVTDFSLILANNNDFGETIYTKYHSNKYKRFQQSEILTVKIIMTDVDWRQMQINTPIFYNNQIYSIMEIQNYDVVKQTATLILIKQL